MSRNTRKRGAVAVWVAITIVVIIGLVGLACDAAYIHLVAQQLHNAADAAALAGAQKIHMNLFDEVRALAHKAGLSNNADATQVQLALNGSNAADGDIVIGRYNRATRTFTPTLVGADAVKVVAKRPDSVAGDNPLPLLFGPIFGAPEAKVSRYAIAMNYITIGPAILVLDPARRDTLHLNGNSEINVDNGGIHVNSTHDDCIVIKGTPDINVSDLNVCADGATASPGNLHGNLNTGAAYMPDPLAHLDFPDTKHMPTLTQDGPVLSPGYYPDGISLNNGSLRLQPGIYVIGGNGLDITGGIFEAEGVLLAVTGSGKKAKMNLDLTGNGRISISPMTADQLPPGAPVEFTRISIFQDPALTSEARLRGNEQVHVEGTIYIPSGGLDVGGTADQYGSQLIVNTLSVAGNSTINVDYQGDFPGSGRPFLVE